MFDGAASFNGDVGDYDVRSVISMYRCFAGCYSFDRQVCCQPKAAEYEHAMLRRFPTLPFDTPLSWGVTGLKQQPINFGMFDETNGSIVGERKVYC